MAADEKVLGDLHTAVATALIDAVKPKQIPGYFDEETGEEVPGDSLGPSPAMLQAAIKFLKDNEITCEPAKDNALGELEQIIAERRKKMQPTPADLDDVKRDTGFLN